MNPPGACLAVDQGMRSLSFLSLIGCLLLSPALVLADGLELRRQQALEMLSKCNYAIAKKAYAAGQAIPLILDDSIEPYGLTVPAQSGKPQAIHLRSRILEEGLMDISRGLEKHRPWFQASSVGIVVHEMAHAAGYVGEDTPERLRQVCVDKFVLKQSCGLVGLPHGVESYWTCDAAGAIEIANIIRNFSLHNKDIHYMINSAFDKVFRDFFIWTMTTLRLYTNEQTIKQTDQPLKVTLEGDHFRLYDENQNVVRAFKNVLSYKASGMLVALRTVDGHFAVLSKTGKVIHSRNAEIKYFEVFDAFVSFAEIKNGKAFHYAVDSNGKLLKR